MAYHGYLEFCKSILDSNPNDHVQVLEIGIDKGVMLIPLVAFLARKPRSFSVAGIDVKLQESVVITLKGLDCGPGQHVMLAENSSLDILPQFVERKTTFDLLLIDGDHNYHTVSKELSYLNQLTHENSIVIIDDYSGRWANRDLWYSEREDYEGVVAATTRVNTEKEGVSPAVNEFLENNPVWKGYQPIPGEPILLTRSLVLQKILEEEQGAKNV